MTDSAKNNEEFRKRNLERIKRLRLMDDDFFRVCFKDDKEGAAFILRIILDKSDLEVTKMRTQYSMKNLIGHSVVLDVLASDSKGTVYNIEIQRSDTGALPKRARYISSIIDANIFRPTENYEGLPQTYVIFITENDVLHENRLIYHIERIITESGTPFNDEAHIIYVNASRNDDSALGRLMHDFKCTDPYQMNYPELREKTIPFKEDEKEAKKMCEIWEEVRREGIAEGIELAKDEIEKANAAKAQAEAEANAAKAQAEVNATKAQAEANAAKAEAEANAAKAQAEANAAKAQAEASAAKAEARERATKTALRMIKRGNLSVEEIAEYTGLTEEEVKEYKELIAD